MYPCPCPPGLQVKYTRFGKSFTPRTHATIVFIWYSDSCVASSRKITSYSTPCSRSRSWSRSQYVKLIVDPLINRSTLSLSLYFAMPSSSLRSVLMWLLISSG